MQYNNLKDYIYIVKNVFNNKICDEYNNTFINPQLLYINLDKDKERNNQFKEEFKNWQTKIERVSGIKHEKGWIGCIMSHLKCIKIAKERNYPWVIICEDDCVLTSSAISQFYNLLPYLWNNKNEWDIFMGGCTSIGNEHIISCNPILYKVSAYTTHFCLINNKTYNKIIDFYKNLDIIKLNEEDYAIDVIYRRNYFVCTTTPFFSKQRTSFSNLANKYVNYNNLFDDSEKILLKLKEKMCKNKNIVSISYKGLVT